MDAVVEILKGLDYSPLYVSLKRELLQRYSHSFLACLPQEE